MKNAFWDEPPRRVVFVQPPTLWVRALFRVAQTLMPTCECTFMDDPEPLLTDQRDVNPTPTCCLLDLDSPVPWGMPLVDGVTHLRREGFLGPILAVSCNIETVPLPVKNASERRDITHALMQLPIRLVRFIKQLKQLRGEPRAQLESTVQRYFSPDWRNANVINLVHDFQYVYPVGSWSPSAAKKKLDLFRRILGDSWADFPILSQFDKLAENDRWLEIAALAKRECSS
jgi:hypothetical protein